MRDFLPQSVLRKILSYDSWTGKFYWRVNYGRSGTRGSEAGYIVKQNRKHSGEGYRKIRIFGREYLAHRLAWFYIHGKWPHEYIDHINSVRDDNRISNLREATKAQNAANTGVRSDNESGFKCVRFAKRQWPLKKPWIATIHKGSKYHHLGYFRTPEEAHAAYTVAAVEHFGEFARLR